MKKNKYKNTILILILLLAFLFITELYGQPAFVWAKQIDSPPPFANEYDRSIAVDANGNVYSVGSFIGTVDFDPGPGVYNLTSVGGLDIFVSKLDVNGNFVWAKNMGGIDDDQANSIAVDMNGDIYLTGFFRDTADFDPSAGVYTLTSLGHKDIFISKLDVNGNFIWAKSMGSTGGGTSHDQGSSIALDANGNVYTTGNFRNIVDFDPGLGVYNLTAVGGVDIFVSKLDANGNFLWAKNIGGSGNEASHSIAVDASGNVHTTGVFQNTADFDPGVGVYNLTSAGGGDIFISKLDVNGNFLWAKSIGGSNGDAGFSIAVDANGNVHTTGTFRNTIDFDPGSGVYNLTNNGNSDIFVSKLDANGNFIWAKNMGGLSHDQGRSIAVDNCGNVLTIGFFNSGGNNNTSDFDPGPGVYNFSSGPLGTSDIFVSKLDANGNFVCAGQMRGVYHDIGNSIALDNNGNIHIIGTFRDTANFDPGSGTYNLISTGNSSTYDYFIVKLAACSICTNSLIASFIPSTTTICEGDSITFTDNSAGTITSWNWTFNGGTPASANTQGAHTVTFNSSGTFNITLQVGDGITTDDTTIVITVNPASSSTQNQSICQGDSIIIGSNTYTTAGTFIDTLTNIFGCDSIVTTNLTISPATTGTDIITACSSITWIDGNTYSASTNTPTFTIVGGTSNGCDSIVTLNLTISPATTGTDVITTCQGDSVFVGGAFQTMAGTYYDTIATTNNCDSILATTLIFNNYFFDSLFIDLCQGDSIYVGGSYQTTSGIYTDTTTNQNGCDSIIQTTLTVVPNPIAGFEVKNTTLSCEGTQVELLNNSTPNNSYLWNFGDEQTSTTEHPTHVFATSGNYNITLTVDSNICSSSHTHTLSIAELELIIPNVVTPNNDGKNDYFTLPLDTELKECSSYKIFNRWGQLLYESKNTEIWDARTTSGKLVPKGTYFYIVEIGTTIYKGTFTIL